ncbi:MAG: hypothetical protein ABIR18_13020 [Chitinophagaceae bacterium]
MDKVASSIVTLLWFLLIPNNFLEEDLEALPFADNNFDGIQSYIIKHL